MNENNENSTLTASEEPDIKELLKIRRDKLSYLQKNNKDPFEITTCNRDIYNKQIVQCNNVLIKGKLYRISMIMICISITFPQFFCRHGIF